jgi:hypothetical protein
LYPTGWPVFSISVEFPGATTDQPRTQTAKIVHPVLRFCKSFERKKGRNRANPAPEAGNGGHSHRRRWLLLLGLAKAPGSVSQGFGGSRGTLSFERALVVDDRHAPDGTELDGCKGRARHTVSVGRRRRCRSRCNHCRGLRPWRGRGPLALGYRRGLLDGRCGRGRRRCNFYDDLCSRNGGRCLSGRRGGNCHRFRRRRRCGNGRNRRNGHWLSGYGACRRAIRKWRRRGLNRRRTGDGRHGCDGCRCRRGFDSSDRCGRLGGWSG